MDPPEIRRVRQRRHKVGLEDSVERRGVMRTFNMGQGVEKLLFPVKLILALPQPGMEQIDGTPDVSQGLDALKAICLLLHRVRSVSSERSQCCYAPLKGNRIFVIKPQPVVALQNVHLM